MAIMTCIVLLVKAFGKQCSQLSALFENCLPLLEQFFLKHQTFVASIQHADVFTLRECLYFMQKIGLQIDFGMV